MGAGASLEDSNTHVGSASDTGTMSRLGTEEPSSLSIVRGGPDRASGRSSRSVLSATGSSIGSNWRSALLSTTLANSTGRKLRAAALGRKSACTVKIDSGGFSLQHIQICEGQVVTFQWEDTDKKGYNITQVYRDGDQYKPVVGGFNSGPITPKGFFEQQFNLKGEYKFVSAGLRCTPLTVEVYPRRDIECKVTENGFEPKMIRIDEGNAVHWNWSKCRLPRSIFEMKFNHKTGTLVHKETQNKSIATKSGDFKHTFHKPGMYYFASDGATTGDLNSCVVHVRERQVEYRIEVFDKSFEFPVLVIEEGDRVWWHWSRTKCDKMHCVYQVEPPPLHHPLDESYRPKKNGFKHPNPSRDGLISAEFFKPGVFHYSDHNFEEAAEYIGTIIVKPKQVEHFIELGQDGFSPDLLYANTGDRIWWTWYADEVDHVFRVMEVEKCISPAGVRNAIENENKGEGSYMDDEIEQTKMASGLETVQLGGIGVYHYRVSDSAHNISTCSVITNAGPKNHTVHVTDTAFEPKVVTIHPGDRVWWVWQDGGKQHNISQVTHQGKHIPGGFCSGAPMDCPSAFMHEFDSLGVFYYTSESLSKAFGAVVVASHPASVHEIQVTGSAITPDPQPINVNDVVAWTFRGLKQSDVCQIMSVDQLIDAKFNSQVVAPRRCMNRLFTTKGVYHFTSKSFGKTGHREPSEDTRLSSVLVDEVADSEAVRVTSKGFHPEHITIYKGESVLWQWKDTNNEAHNIIHVNPPNSEPLPPSRHDLEELGHTSLKTSLHKALCMPPSTAPLSVIQGGESFNSGRPTPNNSFLYTFDEPGSFCVASQGAPGYAGTVHVLAEDRVAGTPYITSDTNGGTVDKFHQVNLATDTHNATIYYTVDGTIPAPFKVIAKKRSVKPYLKHLFEPSSKVYDPSKGIVLKSSGLCFVRAIAVANQKTNSDVFTSKRFWVLSGDEEATDTESEEEQPVEDDNARRHWWNCVPTIKAVFTQPGVMEVFWEPPPEQSKHFIRAYQLFLNGVSYCELFPPIYTSVNVAGLAGGRLYEVILEAYPTDNMFLPHKSNKLMMKCAQTNSTSGPVISLETTPKRDALSIVWMSISTPDNPIAGYRVYLNGQMCGNQVVPGEASDRCKVVIEGCQLDLVYRVVVAAVPEGGGSPKMSNELEITLPLDSEHITLPPRETRLDDDDLYREYIEVRETGDRRKKKRAPRTAVVEIKDDAQQSEPPPAVPVVAKDGDMPAPELTVENQGEDAVLITWQFHRHPRHDSKLLVNVVNIVGSKFKKSVNSDISFECMQEEDNGEAVVGIQHCWNVTSGNQCAVRGLKAGLTYTIYVVANYALTNALQPTEIQAKSQVVKFTTMGPPDSVQLKVTSADLNQVTFGWEPVASTKDVPVTGYQVIVDGKPLGDVLASSITQSTIDNLSPGRSIEVAVVTVTSHAIGNSEPSNKIRVTAPHKPPPPMLTQQPSYKKGTVIMAWDKPPGTESMPHGEDIVSYRVYVDGKWHGEVKATASGNRNGYQYFLNELHPGQTYDIIVKSFAGQRNLDAKSDHMFCLVESDTSNTTPVMCPAPPKSPLLRVEGMHLDGIDVTWEMPQQYGDASVSGYQMLINGKLYGSIIPPDVHTLRVKGVTLGDTVVLQILALTDHPVGRGNEPVTVPSTSDDKALAELFSGDRYGACQPGPKLRIHYTGLVQAPGKVWSENVTGHSAVIVWSKEEHSRQHFIHAESYQVTWWPGDKADADINSQATKDDHLVIGGLKPNSSYTVVVEARRMIKYAELDNSGAPPEHSDGYHNTCILTAQSDPLVVKTARPPSAPTNLSIVSTTCHSIQVGWDAPVEQGADVIGIRVDAVPMNRVADDDEDRHVCAETVPDAAGAIIDNLLEKTEYLITITALTEEFFEQLHAGHDLRVKRALPKHTIPPDDVWLPSSSIMGMTSGTERPTDVRVVKTTIDSVTLTWKNPVVHGTNRNQGTVIRWAECRFGSRYSKDSDSDMAHHKTISADVNEDTIEGLHPGILYKFVVEAVVSVKTTLQQGHHDPDFERQNRRTTHVMSKPIFVRTRAPCEPPFPWVVGYTTETVKLYWEKPVLYKCYGKDEEGYSKYLKLSLEGYRLEINGKPHMRLAPTAQSCTLIKCKPGKTYKIVLIALSCTEEVKKERRKAGQDSTIEVSFSLTEGANREWETIADDFENDESPSKPLHVTVPRLHDGFLSEKSVKYIYPKERLDKSKKQSEDDTNDDYGDICINWKVQEKVEHIKQFNVCWKNLKNGEGQTKVVDAGIRTCLIPATSRRALHDIVVETQFDDNAIPPHVEHVQCLVPGTPDAPDIWLRAVEDREFVIEWGEPRLYANKCAGYQVYLNNKKAGSPLSGHHRKAIIPCKPRRSYKVNMVALSSDKRLAHSELSNTLNVSTGSNPLHMNFVGFEEDLTAVGADDNELSVKVVRVTDATIHLDWSEYVEMKDMGYYRVVWSSVTQPAEREVKLPAGEKSCVIHKCFPGTNHFVRVYAVSKKDQPLDRSRQMTIQTSAAPDPPMTSVRACNFRYIAIEWQKPATYGDAGVTGYKVFVNGVVQGLLSADQMTYSYTDGKWCREYLFQVQALTASDSLASRPSDPLVVTWPGVRPPLLMKAPSVSGNSVKVKWDMPDATDGIKVKQYKLVVLDAENKRPVQVISPIHPESTEAEVHNLKPGNYMAYLEVHVHGCNDVVKSDILHLQPTLTPDPPQIHVTVIGLEERRSIEKVSCDLLNKRDRLLNILASRDPNISPRHQDDQPYTKASESLQQVDEMLDDCLVALEHYTGHILAHVSWNSPQSNPELMVTGYKVLVNSKQYGTTLHAGVKNIRIKLGMNAPRHKITMVSVCDRPHTTSVESNVVELITEPFLPFGFYTFLNQRPKSAKAMGPAYQEALAVERKQGGRKLPINLGLLKRRVPPPACALMDIFEGEYHPMFPPSGPRMLTAILFWSKWCYNSRKMLNWFVKFARMNSTQYDFMAVSCSPHASSSDRIDLVNTITANGWREDGSVRHVMSKSLNKVSSSSPERSGHDCYSHLRGPPLNAGGVGLDATGVKNESVGSTNVTELFGVSGVPTIILVHPQDYIAWKGRYAAIDFSSFDHFMKYIVAQAMDQTTPSPDPWDTNIDTDVVGGAMKRRISENNMLIHRPQYGGTARTNGSSTPTTIHLNGSTRPQSAKRPQSADKRQKLFVKTNKHQRSATSDDKISINNRPFSAPKFSPYAEKLIRPASPQRRAKSGRKFKPTTTY